MTITLDHTIVPSNDKMAGATFLADMLGLESPDDGHFAALRINDHLTFDYVTTTNVESHHYAFLVSDEEFDAIYQRILDQGVEYGSAPFDSANGQINHWRGGRGLYFQGEPDPHLYEIMTVAEAGA